MKFFKKGEVDYVTVDDNFQTLWDGTSLLHGAKSDNGAWWMPILEKGASKFFVNYDNLYAGWA